ncbi:MAG TPA: ATP-binding protein [Candidatus Krumholzibacteria bacterium]|nr:ATP-binding protein [Candidatus Krumholzibacteria bacterium]HRX50803.1 ATP-binding protein [Candidatus Krumholzibacteria bacterium]
MRSPWLCLAMLLIAAAPARALRTVDLDDPPARTPYVLRLPPLHDSRPMSHQVRAGVLGDLDGDGVAECVKVITQGLQGLELENGRNGVLWQHNLEPDFLIEEPPARVGALVDRDGDRLADVVYIADAGDQGRHRLRVWRPATQEHLLDVALPVGADVRADGRWDGRYEVVGILPGARPAAVLSRTVQYDRYDRGVLAYDLLDGRELWSFLMGNNPDESTTRLADLDGDGGLEVVLVGTSPDNLGGEEIHGTSDDACRLYVIEGDGALRWQARLAGVFCTADLDLADLDGDGTLELITATHCGVGATANQLAVWSAREGALLGRKPLGEAACGVAAQTLRDGDARILVGQARSGGLEFRWREGRLTQSAALVTGAGLAMVSRADVLPGEPGDELVAVDVHDRLTVLGSDLRILASDVVPRSSTKLWCEPWRLAEDLPAMVLQGGGFTVLTLQPRPTDARDVAPWIGAGLLAVLGGAGTVALRRRARPAPPALPRRDLHARLLRELAQASHDKLGLTQGLDRLVTQCGYLASESGRTPELLARARDAWTDYEAVGRRRLEELLDLCVLAEMPPALLARARERSAETDRVLGRLMRADLARDDVARELPGLSASVAELQKALHGIRGVVETYVQADLGRVLRRVLLLREDELTRAGVTVESDLPAEGACLVRIDPVDLRFVADNLVLNAVRAFDAGCGDRRLRLAMADEGGLVALRVEDTGRGIPVELHDRIFSGGFSSGGGGLGLARSREILAQHDAELLLERSEPGVGTIFLLRLRRSRPGESESP